MKMLGGREWADLGEFRQRTLVIRKLGLPEFAWGSASVVKEGEATQSISGSDQNNR
jgi:hypothetical protein